MLTLRRVVAVLVGLALGLGLGPQSAQAATRTVITMTAPAAYAGETSTVRIRLTEGDGDPLAARSVVLQRRVNGVWSRVASGITGADGVFTRAVTVLRDPDDNLFRARFAGDATHEPSGTGNVQVQLRQRNQRLSVGGPDRIVDETTVTLTVRRTTGEGDPVGGTVRLDRYENGAWHRHSFVRLGADGRAEVSVRPRVDTRWRAYAAPQPWLAGGFSGVHRLDNVPPTAPVVLPDGAPRPRIALPRQARAVGDGPNTRVSWIPDGVWNDMVGRSWHQGCPVGRSGLRLVRINYWGFDGYRRRGEAVVAAGAVSKFVGAFAAMYRQRLPLRSMYRVDRFGWSDRLQGANDYKSMAAGNTSVFNCRSVVGRPGVKSPHSWGRAVDVNTWENPYHSADGWVPNTWWPSRSHPRVAWRSGTHDVVQIFRNHGFAWTYGTEDSQHFDARSGDGRVMVVPGCENVVCE